MVMFKLPCCWCMSHDVSTNWFFRISLKHRSTIHLSYDLVCNDNSYTKLNKKRAKLQPISQTTHVLSNAWKLCQHHCDNCVPGQHTDRSYYSPLRCTKKLWVTLVSNPAVDYIVRSYLWRRISHVVLHAIFKLCKLFIWAGLTAHFGLTFQIPAKSLLDNCIIFNQCIL